MPSIPTPPDDKLLPWLLQNPEAVSESIDSINKLLAVRVKVIASGSSSLEIGDSTAILTISTKDIDLGTISGAKGGNAALSSVILALKRVFTLTDSTS